MPRAWRSALPRHRHQRSRCIGTAGHGFRIAIGFAFIALVASYVIGVSIGCMMGFLGGRFDLLMQRFIGDLVPGALPLRHHDPGLPGLPNFGLFVGINVLFGWMGITWYMRTLTYKERARDYVMAARAQGGEHPAHHLQPHSAQYPDDDRHPWPRLPWWATSPP